MDKMLFNRPHHQQVVKALHQFNASYLAEHQILFGGGTRIALELGEFRESVDIDFLCGDSLAYKAVRKQVSNHSLGDLVIQDFDYPREIRVDRDAVRCFIRIDETLIKLEFVACADYQLKPASQNFLPVPILDKTSCFITKLLANADRYNDYPYKDIFDLLAIYQAWGEIPTRAWQVSDEIYSEKVVKKGLITALENTQKYSDKFLKIATNDLMIAEDFAHELITVTAQKWLETIT